MSLWTSFLTIFGKGKEEEETSSSSSFPSLELQPFSTTQRIEEILSERPNLHGLENLQSRLEKEIDRFPRPLLLSGELSREKFVRFVHVSDTHTRHWQVKLPPGDVLIHTGDLMGNYGINFFLLERQYDDVVRWLNVVAKKYKLVLIVPGNHDAVLEERLKKRDEEGVEEGNEATVLGARNSPLPSNVKILSGEGVVYRGIRMWGEPHLTSRVEVWNRKMSSNAFELHSSERRRLFENIPPNLHILLTHSPPYGGGLCGGSGDTLMKERLDEMGRRGEAPLFHCFGHDHRMGAAWNGQTMSLNSAQEVYLKWSSKVSGIPWVFDCEAFEEGEECVFYS